MEEVRGIAMVPLDEERVKREIDRFVEEFRIPVVTFTSDVEDTKRLCFVGQNGVQCGRAAAGLMGELTGGKGKVVVISGYSTNTSLSIALRRMAGPARLRKGYLRMFRILTGYILLLMGRKGCVRQLPERGKLVR